MLTVTMPCGAPGQTRERRFRVLQRTCARARPLLEAADEVICLANFGDTGTRGWLEAQPWKPHVVFSKERVTNPEATRLLLTTAVERGATMVLHLEDDWWIEAHPNEDGLVWLDDARDALDCNAAIGQVRLRRTDDYHEEFNWVKGEPLSPTDHGDVRIGNYHATYNPALWRREAILDSFPAEDFWRDEQRTMWHYEQAGWRSAQLVPGVFIHRDDGASVEGVWR